MTISNTNCVKLTMFISILLSIFSCSKDTDLLADYVVSTAEESFVVRNVFVDDSFIINGNDPIVLDVFANDTIVNPEGVKIINITQPSAGEVTIEDNGITYVPKANTDTQEETTDSFTYTTETNQSDGSTSTEETNVVVTKINDEIKYWQRLFDDKWASDNRADAVAKSKSRNRDQEYYFLGYYIDGLSSIWQATGDNSYLDEALLLIRNTTDDAVSVGNGYKGWPSAQNSEHGLWDSFYWRHVATLIRVMYQSPDLRASGYQEQYQELLDFSEQNIWNRYESEGEGVFYRSKTHMASHWARIGMELYIITGKDKYLEVFENISFKTMPNRPSNLRNQLYSNSKSTSGYAWDSDWGSKNGSRIQDTSHAGAIIEFWVLAYENNMYWTKEDIDALSITLDEAIYDNPSRGIRNNVDGSGGYDTAGRMHEWLPLARYNEALHQKIKKDYTGSHLKYFGCQPIGISALNAKILTDGNAAYPEN